MNVNKDGNPETRVDKQAIFKDYGMYDFNKVGFWLSSARKAFFSHDNRTVETDSKFYSYICTLRY
jgi:hypothetical protein